MESGFTPQQAVMPIQCSGHDGPLATVISELSGFVTTRYGDVGLSLSAMESCTGGLLMSSITATPGAGALLGGIVAYDAAVKVAFGVPTTVVEQHGIVAPETALAMAAAARKLTGAWLGLGITGVAGPDPQEGKQPGTVYIAARSEAEIAGVYELRCSGDRGEVREHAVVVALELALAAVDGRSAETTAAYRDA